MKKICNVISIVVLIICFHANAFTQKKSYVEQLKDYQHAYVTQHEVVTGADKKFIQFFPVDVGFRVTATFTKLEDEKGFSMKTSGKKDQHFFRYGKLSFIFQQKKIALVIYRSEALMNDTSYNDYLFLPFTDLTSGEESYAGGRYLDFRMGEIKNGLLIIDFNKAYNPYCAYAAGYNCPIPPRENFIPVAIKAGEKVFAKGH